jgi:hypothetical protein
MEKQSLPPGSGRVWYTWAAVGLGIITVGPLLVALADLPKLAGFAVGTVGFLLLIASAGILVAKSRRP